MDVVTARAEDWQRDPFTLVEESGYLFGCGTVDIKSEIALLVATFLRLKAEGFEPSRDLVLAFSGDEESRMTTRRELMARAREMFDPEFALNADSGEGTLDEATGAPLVYYLHGAEKSYATFEITVRRRCGSSPYAVAWPNSSSRSRANCGPLPASSCFQRRSLSACSPRAIAAEE
jgi:acetylornithine deacetylase/succinyl-diaminopimelate desuccinylase-like protein